MCVCGGGGGGGGLTLPSVKVRSSAKGSFNSLAPKHIICSSFVVVYFVWKIIIIIIIIVST